MKIIAVWGINSAFLSSKVLVWSHFNFVFGTGRAFVMKLLIGLTMGNGRVISATPTGNEIASWKLKWKWDDAGLSGTGANTESHEYCFPGSLRFSCFDNIKGKLWAFRSDGEFRWKQQLLGWHEYVLKWENLSMF